MYDTSTGCKSNRQSWVKRGEIPAVKFMCQWLIQIYFNIFLSKGNFFFFFPKNPRTPPTHKNYTSSLTALVWERVFPGQQRCYLSSSLFVYFFVITLTLKPLAAEALLQIWPGHGGCVRICHTAQRERKRERRQVLQQCSQLSALRENTLVHTHAHIWLEVTRVSSSGYKQKSSHFKA